MSRAPFLPMLRELARCFQSFEACSAAQIREFGLTPAQFDILATLGDTPGMAPKELGEKTLITKGTLTGVGDRMAAKGLVRRSPSPQDGRSQIVRLTRRGETLFDKAFPAHLAHLGRALASLTAEDLSRIETAMRTLRMALDAVGAKR